MKGGRPVIEDKAVEGGSKATASATGAFKVLELFRGAGGLTAALQGIAKESVEVLAPTGSKLALLGVADDADFETLLGSGADYSGNATVQDYVGC